MAVPLKRWGGTPIGVLQICPKWDRDLNGKDLAVVTIVSALAAASLERLRLLEESKMAEVIDTLDSDCRYIRDLLILMVSNTQFLESKLKILRRQSPEF